jgi:iron complex transport system ATP-binding protein
MLSIDNLSVSYAARRVLHSVSLEVGSGQVVALIGPNGAGKSTLIRAVSGVIPVEAGSVCADGQDLLLLPSMKRARHLAVVPQAVSMPPAFTAWETVLLGRTPYLNFLGQVSEKDEAIARRALQRVEALDLAERRVGELSGGEQQRVLLARALAQDTPILLMDEPTSNLDLRHQSGFLDAVRNLAHTDHLAVLIAIHDLNLAAAYADTLVLLVSGEVKSRGTARQVLTPQGIAEAYGVTVDVLAHPLAADLPLLLPPRASLPPRPQGD